MTPDQRAAIAIAAIKGGLVVLIGLGAVSVGRGDLGGLLTISVACLCLQAVRELTRHLPQRKEKSNGTPES